MFLSLLSCTYLKLKVSAGELVVLPSIALVTAPSKPEMMGKPNLDRCPHKSYCGLTVLSSR